MSLKEHKSWALYCDVCGDSFEDTSGFSVWLDQDAALETAREYDWAVTLEGRRAVCPSLRDDHKDLFAQVSEEWERTEDKWEALQVRVYAEQSALWREQTGLPHLNRFDRFYLDALSKARAEWVEGVRKREAEQTG